MAGSVQWQMLTATYRNADHRASAASPPAGKGSCTSLRFPVLLPDANEDNNQNDEDERKEAHGRSLRVGHWRVSWWIIPDRTDSTSSTRARCRDGGDQQRSIVAIVRHSREEASMSLRFAGLECGRGGGNPGWPGCCPEPPEGRCNVDVACPPMPYTASVTNRCSSSGERVCTAVWPR